MDRLGKIIVLDEQTANKIAAGEVVDRPASIVKELVENSIDAGARRITIELEEGGSSLIRVSDDGWGISPAEVNLAFLRHATSKLRAADDLLALSTMGFRGEALPSIAAVSRLEMKTRREEDPAGSDLFIEGGVIRHQSETGCPVGTSITVTDLFYNTPARRAFLKSAATEGSSASDIITRLALAHPEIAFRLLSSGQLVFQSPGSGRQLEVISSIYGKEIARRLLPVDYRTDQLSVQGYISPPAITRATRNAFSFFVNRRYIRSQVMSDAVLEAYHSYLPLHRFPIVVISLTADPAAVDVNVHPTKMEVRFNAESDLYSHLLTAISQGLRSTSLIPEVHRPVVPMNHLLANQTAFQDINPGFTPNPATIASPPTLGQSGTTPKQADYPPDSRPREGQLQEWRSAYSPSRPEAVPGFPALNYLGQVLNTYLLAQSGEGLYIVDQHAAQERITFERLRAARDQADTYCQALLVPVILELTPPETAILREHLAVFNQVGFQIEAFGGSSFILRGVPAVFALDQAEIVLHNITEALLQRGTLPRQSQLVEELIIQAACKASIRANERLSRAESESLLQQLAATPNPYTCPHGRPTVITLTAVELEKLFKRV